jgi:alkylation response protein AidB-like acyl-CoA dehydrogenase
MTPLDELTAFLESHVPPAWVRAVADGDHALLQASRDDLDAPAFVRDLGRAGWVAPDWPRACGGRGLDRADTLAVAAELDRWNVPRIPRGAGLGLAAPTILQWAEDATKARFLPRIATGEDRWCQLFSEPGAGSDLASLATSAVRDGDEWVVNGQKVWTTYGHESERAMLLARTDPSAPKHAGITYFGLDLSAPGVEIRPLVQMTGEREFNEVFLTDVRLPDIDRISPVGQGWAATQTTLGAERHALSGVRKKRKASDEILGGKTVEQVEALAAAVLEPDDGARRQRVVQDHIRGTVLSLTTRRFAAERRAGAEGSLTKIAKASGNQSLQVTAMELLGARGQAWEPGDEDSPGFVREFLRTRANSIEGGTSEVQHNIVGERVLGLPREPDAYKGQPWQDVPRS